jgi:hypothetical protein
VGLTVELLDNDAAHAQGPHGRLTHVMPHQGLRAGVESYSLKEVEALVPYARQADVRSGIGAALAAAAGGKRQQHHEQWRDG